MCILWSNIPIWAYITSFFKFLDHTQLGAHTPQFFAEVATYTTHNKHQTNTHVLSRIQAYDPRNQPISDYTLEHMATDISKCIIYVGCAMDEVVRHWPVTVYAQC